MMMPTKKLVLFAVILVVLLGCQAGLSAQDLAATMVAGTAAAASDTPVPVPSDTPAPPTITPTSAPTLTPTPTGPLVIKDDFSTKSDIWGRCDECEWKDNKLYFGPYAPRGEGINQVFAIVCEACGEHPYFRIAADITFADGVAGDRLFGVGLIIPDQFYAGTGIAPSQIGLLDAYDFGINKWTGSPLKRYGAIKPGGATNRVEFAAKPNSSGGTDYYAIVNGKTLVVLPNITDHTEKLKPCIYLGWHSVGIAVDNFEYEEIVP
jgi:hypothetical protein